MFPTMMTLSANLLKIHFLEFCQTNLSLTGSQFCLILSLPILFSLFLPSTNKSLFQKCNVLFSLVNKQFTNEQIFQYQISLMSKFPVLSISLFSAWIWPGFIQKSSLFYQQSLGMIQTCVPIFLKSLYSLDDKIRTTVQLITYTVPQNCLSLHNSL